MNNMRVKDMGQGIWLWIAYCTKCKSKREVKVPTRKQPSPFCAKCCQKTGPERPLKESFMSKIKKLESGCWEWLAYRDVNGYGMMGWGSLKIRAHQAAWLIFKGPLSKSLVINHRCENKWCSNPAHLEQCTDKENSWYSAKTHCKQGHALDEANTYWRKDTNGRMCRACHRIRERARQRRLAKSKRQ